MKAACGFGLRLAFALVLTLSGTSCETKTGDAVVLAKEFIATREPTPTPTPGTPVPTIAPSADDERVELRALRDGEIDVDGYVMPRDVRGTGRDPRALDRDQWRITVRMARSNRQFVVHIDEPRWQKTQVGDVVKVSYKEGKYTGTVWGSELK